MVSLFIMLVYDGMCFVLCLMMVWVFVVCILDGWVFMFGGYVRIGWLGDVMVLVM